MNTVWVLYGGNLGDVQASFRTASDYLVNDCDFVKVKASSLYSSEAWGFEGPDFLNQVVIYKTALNPIETLHVLLETERNLKRMRSEKSGYESRTLDLDLLYFNEEVIRTDDLEVPHPRLQLRRFTLLPVVELEADFVHPVSKKTQRMLLDECPDESDVRKL